LNIENIPTMTTLDILAEAERRQWLSVTEVSAKLALLAKWNVGIPVKGRYFPTCASRNNMWIKRGFTPYPLHVSPFWRQCRDESALLGRFAFAKPESLLRDAPRAHRLDAGLSIIEAIVVRTRSMGTGGCDGE
jgi:hypothetical protein